jgi:hypothetical protein
MDSTIKIFQYYKLLGEAAIDQLKDTELFSKMNETDNSIPVIVKHLWGNMRSRWTDFLESDGEKEWRKRDEEFLETIENRSQLIEKWEAGWTCLFYALESITPADMIDRKVMIRNQEHSITEAVQRQLAHYAYHIGQIVYIAKHLKGHSWESLSIPKNQSEAFNQKKFTKDQTGHFTDDFRSNKQ